MELMETVLEAKAKQVAELREELWQSQSNRLVEAVTGDFFWSSVLNKEETLNTKVRFRPGENQMHGIVINQTLRKYKTKYWRIF